MILVAGIIIAMSIRNNVRSVFIKPMMAFLRKMTFIDGGDEEYTGYGLRIAMLNLPPRAIMLMLLVAVHNFGKSGMPFEGMYLCITYGKYMVAFRNLDGFSLSDYDDVKTLIRKNKELNLVLYCGTIRMARTLCNAFNSPRYLKMSRELNKINFSNLTKTFHHLL